MPRKRSTIIVSEKIEKRNPFFSFIMSLAFTGLGQAYNGSLSHGLTLLALRTLALLLIPFTAMIRQSHSYMAPFIVLSAGAVIATIASPVEAAIVSAVRRETPLKRYNSPIFYGVYAAAAATLTALALAAVIAIFSFQKTPDDAAFPSAASGELLLIAYHPGAYGKGDLVIYENGKIGRILAGPESTVQMVRNCYTVDGTPLYFGRWEDERSSLIPQKSIPFIHVEKGNGKEYPILAEFTGQEEASPLYAVPEGSFFIAADNRVPVPHHQVVPAAKIKGRVEGILIPAGFSRMFMKPYIGTENHP